MYFIHSVPPGAGRVQRTLSLNDRERLRHLIIGSPEGVRSAIHTLHVLRYAEQLHWSRLFTIPDTGVVLTPDHGEMFSYLLRYRPLE